MKIADASELKSNCSTILSLVRAGEEVVITQDGKPVARLVPAKREETERENSTQIPAATRENKGKLK